jgi:hypothetical protein
MHVEDRLAGARNWSPWKARMVFVLEYLELWDIVKVYCSRLGGRVQEEEQQGKEDHL